MPICVEISFIIEASPLYICQKKHFYHKVTNKVFHLTISFSSTSECAVPTWLSVFGAKNGLVFSCSPQL